MNEKLRYLPNCITVMRIIGTLALLLTKPMSLYFCIIYAITGVTDVLDGFIARKLKLTSDTGAKLDSAADLLFYAVMLLMILPVLWIKLPKAIWIFVALAILLRLGAYITAAIKYHRFAASHSMINKITGACVFSIPFILLLPIAVPICWVICFVSFVGSFSELVKYLSST